MYTSVFQQSLTLTTAPRKLPVKSGLLNIVGKKYMSALFDSVVIIIFKTNQPPTKTIEMANK